MTPILVPAKGTSVRCPGKNIKLLHYLSFWLSQENKDRVYVISDDTHILELAKKLGMNTFYSSVTGCELVAMGDFVKAYNVDQFIYLPLTQPLREKDLIDRIDEMAIYNDFIVSISKYKKRDLFEVCKEGFVNNSEERKGKMCPIIDHVDGAIYKIKSKHLLRCIDSDNSNKSFWGGKFDTIVNNMPFLDIDEIEDLDQLKNLLTIFK